MLRAMTGRRRRVVGALGLLLTIISAVVVVVPSIAADDSPGLFSASCRLSHVANDDPIVFPGLKGAAHTHEFTGAWSTDAFTTPQTLAASGTTCDPAQDKSAYWAPALYLRGQLVEVHHFSAYYGWGRRTTAAQRGAITGWPDGFRMIAQLKDSTMANTGDPHAGWQCGDGAFKWGYKASLTTALYHCPEGVFQTRVLFPDCWDGVNLDTINPDGTPASNPVTGLPYPNDHRSHTAYADVNGDCPPTHPVATPRLDFRVQYKTRGLVDSAAHRPTIFSPDSEVQADTPYDAPKSNEATDASQFTLAGGGLAGAPINDAYPLDTFHADFFNGWDPATFTSMIDYCLRQGRSMLNTRPCLNPNSDAVKEAAPNPGYPNATQPASVATPVVAISAPAPNASISGKVTVTATASEPLGASDGSNISSMQFLVDGVVKATDKSHPYAYSLDTKTLANGSHTITAVAFDKSKPTRSSSASVAVTVLNRDTTKPSTPSGLSTTQITASTVGLTWKPSTDDASGIAHYNVLRDGTLVGTPSTTSYEDGGLAAGSKHSYVVQAVDGAGNTSSSSSKKSVTTAKR
jgi:hypothetical protein